MVLVSTVIAPYDDDNPRDADNHRHNDEYPHQYICLYRGVIRSNIRCNIGAAHHFSLLLPALFRAQKQVLESLM